MKEIKEYHRNGRLHQHYWVNEKGNMEGEHKLWHDNGQLWTHYFCKNGLVEGEYKIWDRNGRIEEHIFFHNAEEVNITEYATDINNITESEYFQLQLIFGYFPVIKYSGKL